MTDKLNKYLKEYYETFFILNKKWVDFNRFVESIIECDESQKSMIEVLKKEKLLSDNIKILILGCGSGKLERSFTKQFKNIFVVGVDVSLQGVAIANLLKENSKTKIIDYLNCVGEKLPFKSETFDVVISNQVLEHVKDLKLVFQEIFRVLKNDGQTYHFCPNYRSFYEAHYKIFWFPILSKSILSSYLKLRGLKTDILLNHLNLITYNNIKNIINESGFNEISGDMFKQHLISKLQNPENISNKKAKRLIFFLKYVGLLSIFRIIIQYNPFFHIFHIKAKK
ncbi:MAG TPA: class I SAM-dependent methyltransferase [bacterium]|nr:class I SAM-dependent methyltransferase [bacterium]